MSVLNLKWSDHNEWNSNTEWYIQSFSHNWLSFLAENDCNTWQINHLLTRMSLIKRKQGAFLVVSSRVFDFENNKSDILSLDWSLRKQIPCKAAIYLCSSPRISISWVFWDIGLFHKSDRPLVYRELNKNRIASKYIASGCGGDCTEIKIVPEVRECSYGVDRCVAGEEASPPTGGLPATKEDEGRATYRGARVSKREGRTGWKGCERGCEKFASLPL